MSRIIKNDGVPLEPLWAPRVEKADAKPIPVNWFERIAPRLDAEPGDAPETGAVEPWKGEPCAAVFADVDEMALEARLARQRGAPEPPELVRMRRNAEAEAQRIVAEAEARAETLQKEAVERGFAAGFAEGRAAGEASARAELSQQMTVYCDALRQDVSDFVDLIEDVRRRAWADMEPQVVALVFDLAKQVIKSEVEVNRQVALNMVQNALRRVADTHSLRIRVHADDLETVRSHRADLMGLVDNIRHVEIIEDRRVSPGGCIVETDAGNIDARIETQLETAGETLNGLLLQRDAVHE